MNKPISDHKLFINIARICAKKSKDPNTQVGAVIVSPDQRRIRYGYNAFPKNIQDTEKRWERPTKYDLVVHAELNAILCARTSLCGWTLYVTIPPCLDCCKAIIQAGIKTVIFDSWHYKDNGSLIDYSKSFNMLGEAGIRVYQFVEKPREDLIEQKWIFS